jgi:hypothetical protein
MSWTQDGNYKTKRKGGFMFTAPLAIDTNSHMRAQVVQADTQANLELQSRFPTWAFMSGQYNANGEPYKAHIRDREGRIWTVWFGPNDQITRVAQDNQ